MRLIVIAVLCLSAGAACAPVAAEQRPVVLILLDTLRADHTSVYGYERDTTPELVRQAADGAVVEFAFSAAAWTLPSVTSILTGQWPSVHGAGFGGDNRFARLDAEMPTVTELLQAAGYRTGAVASAGYFDEEFGFGRGFEHYDFVTGNDETIRRADESVGRALEWLDTIDGEPFFLLFQAFDIHRHYDAPEPARGAYTDAFADRYGDTLSTLESRLRAEAEGDLAFTVAAYDEEILFVDAQVGRLLDGLRDRGLWEETLVILTADHGEAFFEHDARGHGSSVHNEVVRVPFLVWGPEVPAGRVTGPVSNVDIFPTILDFVGIEAPPVGGQPIWRQLGGEPAVDRILFAENAFYDTSLTAAVRWPYKAIRDFEARETRLYDLSSDPGEEHDLMLAPDREARQTARELTRQARDLRLVSSGEGVVLDEATRDRLRALGYIQ